MGLNLKEKLQVLKEKIQKINKRNLVILIIVLFVIAGGVFGLVSYLQYKNEQNEAYRAQEEEIIKSIFGERSEPEDEPTKKPSEYKIGISYENAMKAKKPVLVLFYADWCGYCIRFMPKYQELSQTYKKEMNFAKVNVEDPKYKKVVTEIGIGGFPTVYIIDPKYDNRVLLSNAVLSDIDKISAELDRFLRIRSMLDEK